MCVHVEHIPPTTNSEIQIVCYEITSNEAGKEEGGEQMNPFPLFTGKSQRVADQAA